MQSSELSKHTAESGDKELDELRRNLDNALAEEEKIICKIENLENKITSVQFNDLKNQRPSQMQHKAIANVHEVQNTRKTSPSSEFMEHINTDIADLDALLSGVTFTVHTVRGSPNGIQYILHVTAGKVLFFLRFHWLEELKSVKNTQVVIPSPLHKAELSSIVHVLERNNNVHKIVRIVTNYSEAIAEREEMLLELERKHAPFFKYCENSEKGYKFEISDNTSERKYFFSTWTITHYKIKNNMDHCFNFHIVKGAEDLAEAQKEIFLQLTRDPGPVNTNLDIIKLIGILVQGFLKWQLEMPARPNLHSNAK